MRVWTLLAYGPENADDPVSEIVRITARQYDGQGRLSKITAVLPDHQGGVTTYDDVDFEREDLQVTELIHDTGSTNCAEGAEILNTAGEIITCNNGFIAEVRFPDPVDGQPDMADRIAFQYNSDGSLATRTDQRGVIFSHTYDDLGRKTQTEIDDSIWFVHPFHVPENRIRKITYENEPTGEPSLIIAYTINTAGRERIVSQNEFDYTDFRNLLREWQAHGTSVAPNTPSVHYTWDISPTGQNSFQRLASIQYPVEPENRSEALVSFDYGDNAADLDSSLNRITAVSVNEVTGAATYDYTGTSRRVGRTLGAVAFQAGGGGSYGGLDRYGRLIDLHYELFGSQTVRRYKYGYDDVGNRLFAKITQSGGHDNDRSYLYAYDGLHRLVDAQMGELASDNQSIVIGGQAPIPLTTTWTLDNLSNWSGDPNEESVVITGDFDGDGVPDPDHTIHHVVETRQRAHLCPRQPARRAQPAQLHRLRHRRQPGPGPQLHLSVRRLEPAGAGQRTRGRRGGRVRPRRPHYQRRPRPSGLFVHLRRARAADSQGHAALSH